MLRVELSPSRDSSITRDLSLVNWKRKTCIPCSLSENEKSVLTAAVHSAQLREKAAILIDGLSNARDDEAARFGWRAVLEKGPSFENECDLRSECALRKSKTP